MKKLLVVFLIFASGIAFANNSDETGGESITIINNDNLKGYKIIPDFLDFYLAFESALRSEVAQPLERMIKSHSNNQAGPYAESGMSGNSGVVCVKGGQPVAYVFDDTGVEISTQGGYSSRVNLTRSAANDRSVGVIGMGSNNHRQFALILSVNPLAPQNETLQIFSIDAPADAGKGKAAESESDLALLFEFLSGNHLILSSEWCS